MVSAILAIIIVNVGHKLLMRLLGANIMFFDWRKKIAWYVTVWFFLFTLTGI